MGALPSGDEGRLRCLNEKRFLPNLHKTFKCTYTTANSFMCHKILLCGSNFVTAVKNKPKKSSLVLCVTKKNILLPSTSYATAGAYKGGCMRATPLRNSKICISAIICQKLSSGSSGNCNVIVDGHNCNCSMHLLIFSTLEA